MPDLTANWAYDIQKQLVSKSIQDGAVVAGYIVGSRGSAITPILKWLHSAIMEWLHGGDH